MKVLMTALDFMALIAVANAANACEVSDGRLGWCMDIFSRLDRASCPPSYNDALPHINDECPPDDQSVPMLVRGHNKREVDFNIS